MKKIGFIIFFIVSNLLYLFTSQTRAAFFLLQNCPNTTVFTPNSTYQSNLKTVFSLLSSNATNSPTGFYNSSTGINEGDVAYGIFLCRGDVNSDVCRDCVHNATGEALNRCPQSKDATMWYDYCMIRYSNQQFLGSYESRGGETSWGNYNVSDPKGRFEDVLGKTLKDTTDRAVDGDGSGKNYAVGEDDFSPSQKVYVLAQCTPDLTKIDCDHCLSLCIGKLVTISIPTPSARVLMPSCNVEFETFQFFNKTPAVAPVPSPPSPLPSSLLSPPSPPAKGNERKSSKALVAIVVAIGACVLLLILVFCLLTRISIRKKNGSIGGTNDGGNDITMEHALQYDLDTIKVATNNFSPENKIGEGGFGLVYKGVLANGLEVAVKRLSQNSEQGAREFKNEVVVVAKLHHKNLVKLLGFCLEGLEKILVYEFVPNKSLDYLLFDPQESTKLDWPTRYKIIAGITRGMLYLHEDAHHLKIIHRDLKAANVLLDEEMNAKVADFGLARIFGVDQTHGITSRAVGTRGYVSPEYLLGCQFSVKSDAFSFGVLILEIISGKRSNSRLSNCNSLQAYAWELWEEGRPLDFMDPALEGSYCESEVRRCIHIGLLCVQDDPDARLSMETVLLMLNMDSVNNIQIPQKPVFVEFNQTVPTLPNMIDSDQSRSQPIPLSVNQVTITDLYPR